MEIRYLKKVNNGRIKADFSVVWEGRLAIHHCVLMENDKGKLYIKFPWRTYEVNGKKAYESVVEVDQVLMVKISELALHEYGVTK